jgi:acid phosphatase|tara:strand:- start:1290 stop:2114 length:825 start_codon:yes stop_codon:yes gene_type:complete
MKSLSRIFLIILFTSSSYSFSSEKDKSFQEQSILSVLYVQTSTEFAANNLQTYLNATEALERALEDSSWSAALEQKENFSDKPPAIIIDIDETVLDNSPFQSRTILSGLSYPNGWSEWVNESKADAVEGVYDFLHYANEKEVEIFYLTNRLESYRAPTIRNLLNLGLPFKNDNMLLMRKEENSRDKTERRKQVADKNRVVLIIGDQLTDFISTKEAYVFHTDRKKLAKKYSDMWGTKWFMITNPTYGRWELSIYENMPESEEAASEIRKKTLRP